MKTVAVLALQGAFIEHEQRLAELGCATIEARNADDLEQEFDALVLPGGESTVQAKLLHGFGMLEPLKERIRGGMPVLGTCAGAILLADTVEDAGGNLVDGFRTLPITIRRNGYGRQLASFHANAMLTDSVDQIKTIPSGYAKATPANQAQTTPIDLVGTIPATFIRAPRIVSLADDVQIIASLDGEPVAVHYGNQFACTFHPELDSNNVLFDSFLRSIQ